MCLYECLYSRNCKELVTEKKMLYFKKKKFISFKCHTLINLDLSSRKIDFALTISCQRIHTDGQTHRSSSVAWLPPSNRVIVTTATSSPENSLVQSLKLLSCQTELMQPAMVRSQQGPPGQLYYFTV